MPFAGFLVAQGKFTLIAAATAGAVGENIGAGIAYEIGKRGGRPLILRYGRYLLIDAPHVDAAERFFARWGSAAALIGRLLPIVAQLHRLPRGDRADEPGEVPSVHDARLVAVVFRARLGGDEARQGVGQRPAAARRVPFGRGGGRAWCWSRARRSTSGTA